MYDCRFKKAKTVKGILYRNQKTGDLEQYCSHYYIIFPVYEIQINYHAGFIPLNEQKLDKFEGICQDCGDVIMIGADCVVGSREEFDKKIEGVLKEKELE